MKIGIVVLADTETHRDLGRAVNALIAVQEAKEAGDEIRLIFDGSGTKWVGELADPDHRSHRPYKSVEDQITGVCQHCAKAFGATEAVETDGIPFLDDYKQHPSLRTLVHDGFEVLVF